MPYYEEDWDDRGLYDPYFDPTDNIPYGYEDEGIESDDDDEYYRHDD